MTECSLDLGGKDYSQSIVNSGSSVELAAESIIFGFKFGIIDADITQGDSFWLTAAAECYFGEEISIVSQQFTLSSITYTVSIKK